MRPFADLPFEGELTDHNGDPDLDTAPPPGAIESADATSEAAPNSGPDRRAFLRQLSGDAVSTAGRLASLSSIIGRSVVAAGEAAIGGLETPSEDEQPTSPAPGPGAPVVIEAPPIAPPQPDPVLTLTPAQHAVLAGGARLALAVNDPAGAPHLTSSMYHWDGMLVRVPAQLFTARSMNVERDPRISLLIEDGTSEAWVALSGVASVVYDGRVEGEMMLILSKYLAEDAAARRWQEMRASGDRIVIQVRPTRFVWRPA